MGLLIALVVAGCGASKASNETGRTESSLDKAEFIKQADVICARQNKLVQYKYFDALAKHIHSERETPAEHQAHDVRILKLVASRFLRREVEEIRALGMPEGDGAEVERFLAAMEVGIKEAEKDPGSFIRTSGKEFAKPAELAREYGFKTCGRRG